MNEYVIYGETLTAAANAIRESLNAAEYSIDQTIKADRREIRWIEQGNVNVLYREFVDFLDSYSEGIQGPQDMESLDKTIVAYSYQQNNEGNIVPVLYWTSNPDPDTSEPLYYIGQEVVNGETCDKWRKIDGDSFGWDEDAKYYIYTESIVNINSEIEGINPVDFPAHIYTIASSTGVTDDRYDEGYQYGYEDGIVIGSEQATLNYAPMIIQGRLTGPVNTGADYGSKTAYSSSNFTNVAINDIIYTYTNILTYTSTGTAGSTPYIKVTNSNPVLTVEVYAKATCIVTMPSGGTYELYDYGTATIAPGKTVNIYFDAGTIPSSNDKRWQFNIQYLKWNIN